MKKSGVALASGYFHAAAGLIVILVAVALYLQTHGLTDIPCVMDCGETFVALQQANQFHRYGFAFGLLQDHATSDLLAAHPYLYTHNVSLPSILFPLLAWSGLREVWQYQFLTLTASLLGLAYVYLAVLRISRSSLLAMIMLAFMCTDYLHVYGFMLNALRAWHWLALFGTIYHAYVLAEDRVRLGERKCDYAGLLVFAFVSFGIGYDFWVICAAVALTVIFAFPGRLTPGVLAKLIILVGLMFCVPAVLRQIQVVWILGPQFWWQDLLFSVAIKVPYLDRLITLPSIGEIELFYRNSGIMRPPAAPATSWTSIVQVLRDLIRWEVLPSYGLLTMSTFVILLFVAAVHTAWVLLDRIRPPVGSHLANEGTRPELSLTWTVELRLLRLLCAVTIGIGIGLFVLAPLSLHIYLKHQFPLLAAPFNLAKTIFVGALLVLLRGPTAKTRLLFGAPRSLRFPAACAVVLVIIDHLVIQAHNLRQPALDTTWSQSLRGARDSVAISWISDAVDAFSHNWSIGIPPGIEREVADRIRTGAQPFRLSEYVAFGQRDGAARAREYERPDFWLYFGIEHVRNFDSPSPLCRDDYLTSALARLLPRRDSIPVGGIAVVPVSGPFAPGGLVPVFGTVEPSEGLSHIEVSLDGKQKHRLNYNCIYGSYAGVVRLPLDDERPSRTASVIAVVQDGSHYELASLPISIDPSGKSYSRRDLAPWSNEPQLKVEELADLINTVPVAARGSGWAIFDMRSWYASHGH